MATAMKRVMAAASVAVAAIVPLTAQAVSDKDVLARIREEANRGSQIMHGVHVLADVYGPRLTGSPALKAAGEWAIRTMESWGLTNGHLEPWTFGYDGWTNERFSAHIIAPVKDALVGEVLAWTPGTNGTVAAPAFHLKVPERPTTDQLTSYFNSVREQVRDRIVLVDQLTAVAVDMNPPRKREDDEAMQRRFGPNPQAPPDRAGSRRDPAGDPPLSSTLVNRRIDEFLLANGARVRVDDARRGHGQVAAFNNPTYDVKAVIPSVILRNEDYGRIARILAGGTPVELEFTIVNKTHPEGRTAYNAVAEISGSDKADEVVIIGGHLDSWQSATGATDNAVGCAVLMEAVRILRAIGVRPRRTIRVALWSGEEQGLLGAQAYVQQHFGSFENPKPAFGKLMAYLNLDHGTGRPRGAVVFGPASAASVVRQLVAPFADLGIVGAVETRSRAFGTTDHTAFNNAGLPGVDFELDPIEYETHTHHTNLDTYERILESDARASAIIVAATAYQLSMRDQLLPRFTRGEMPVAR
jgi:carboxypeptidase Q